MTGYRVAVDRPTSPLDVDVELCRTQFFRQRLVAHAAITLFTLGLWLPGLLVWLVASRRGIREWAEGYTVRIEGGALTAGTATSAHSVPLDAVADVSASHGYVNVSIRGSRPLTMFGLRDPLAASRAILAGRDAHVRELRSELRDEVVDAAPSAAHVRR